MEWSNKDCLDLIGAYEKQSVLWDIRHHMHNSKVAKQDAWMAISRELNIEVEEVRKKINSLLGSFRRERSKARNSLGNGKDRAYVSKWFAFDRMHFLLDRREPRQNNDSAYETGQDDNDPTEIKCEPDINADERLSIGELAMEYQNKEMLKNNIEHDNYFTERRPLKRKPYYDESKLDDVLQMIKSSVTAAMAISSMDDCSVYGQHVANKLRCYSARTRAIVEHNINNELFKADLGEYDGTNTEKDLFFYPSFSYQDVTMNQSQEEISNLLQDNSQNTVEENEEIEIKKKFTLNESGETKIKKRNFSEREETRTRKSDSCEREDIKNEKCNASEREDNKPEKSNSCDNEETRTKKSYSSENEETRTKKSNSSENEETKTKKSSSGESEHTKNKKSKSSHNKNRNMS